MSYDKLLLQRRSENVYRCSILQAVGEDGAHFRPRKLMYYIFPHEIHYSIYKNKLQGVFLENNIEETAICMCISVYTHTYA